MFDINFSLFQLLLAVGFSAITLIIISVIKKYFPAIINKYRPNKKEHQTWIYTIELLVILTLLIVFIGYLSKRNTVAAMALTVALIMAVYYLSTSFLKNYLNGLLIKSTGQYKVGDLIVMDQYKGKISRLGTTQVRINNADSQTVYIPYSWIYTKPKTIQQTKANVNGYSFFISLKNSDIQRNTIEEIRQIIAQTPWTHPTFEIEIELAENNKTEKKYKITVYALSKYYQEKIEQKVKKQFKFIS